VVIREEGRGVVIREERIGVVIREERRVSIQKNRKIK